MRAKALPIAVIAILATALPALAQDVTATLRTRGNVMVSTGGEFVTARDGQPVLAGQRILVGDGASATVEYGRDCKQSFDTAGVHVIPPGRCDDNDNDNDDRDEDNRSREREQSGEQGAEQSAAEQGAGGQGTAAASGMSGTWTSLAAALGGVAAAAAAIEEQDASPPDHPISR